MRCRDVRSRLEVIALDGGAVKEHGEVCSHLKDCLECMEFWKETRALTDFVRSRPRVPEEKLDAEIGTWFALSDSIREERSRDRTRTLSGTLRYVALTTLVTAVFAAATLRLMDRPAAAPSATTTESAATQSLPEVHYAWVKPGLPKLSGPGPQFYCADSARIYMVQQTPGGAGRICAVDPDDGDVLWHSEPIQIAGMTAGESGVFALVLTDESRHLQAWDAATGKVLWTQATHAAPPEAATLVALRAGRLALSEGRTVSVYDTATGLEIWSADTEEPVRAICAIGTGDVLTASDKGVKRLAGDSGMPLWSFGAAAQGLHWLQAQALASADGHVYWLHAAKGAEMELTCLDATTTEVAWTRPAPRSARHVLADAQGVYVRGQKVEARAASDGQVRWRRSASGCGSMALSDGALHMVDATGEGRLVALDLATGNARWQVRGLLSCQALELRDGIGYVATQEGMLIAVPLPKGSSS